MVAASNPPTATDTAKTRNPGPGAAGPSIIVSKYGGSSLATPEHIRAVADRLVAARNDGSRHVVVVSAMGDATDALLDLAAQVSNLPDPRELDLLLSTGERVTCALAAMVINDLGHEAISLTGSQAGIVTDSGHTKARILEVKAHRIREALT